MEQKLRKVCGAFRIHGTFESWSQIKVGNVNQTYRVNFISESGKEKSYLVQNLNLFVFKNPQQVMRNIDLVTEHIRTEKMDGVSIHFHHVATGENYYVDENGFWRMQNFITSKTYDVCTELAILYNAGAAFGEFQSLLSNFDASNLFETIADFHHTPKRLETLFADAARDAAGRTGSVAAELDFIRSMQEEACRMQRMLEVGELPLRVTHNDTKINNVLFDPVTHKALVVIDLDTVMPGLVGHDFGDAVRFACNFVEEDCPDTERVGIDMEKFRALCEGFLSAVHLTKAETDTLALSCLTLTVELAARFLADYLNGDVYFRTEYPKHNLVRTRCQIALAKDMIAHMDEMNAIVQACAAKH